VNTSHVGTVNVDHNAEIALKFLRKDRVPTADELGCGLKGTLLGEQRMFSSVSRLLLEEISWFITHFPYAHAI
jgi:hypothetical protein